MEIVGERYTTCRVEEVFGYDPAWRQLSPERVREIEGLIGPPDLDRGPGENGGPIPGDDSGDGGGTHREGVAGEESEAGLAAGGD